MNGGTNHYMGGNTTHQNCAHALEEKMSFATCLMQLQVSYATKKCHMQLFFSCM